MSTQHNPRREHPGTYIVPDQSLPAELTRLQILGQMLTAGMGGVLPEQPNPTLFPRVLDVGCGTGEWLIEAAKTSAHLTMLVGVDISAKMLAYARAQARTEGVSDRVEFHAMDAVAGLEFPSHSFDLLNQRLAQGWVRTWDWPKLLQEYQRVTRPGGLIRLTEVNFAPTESSSPTFNRLSHLFLQALQQAGHYFSAQGDGITSHLVRLLRQHGVQNVQARAHTLHYRVSTPEGQRFVEEQSLVFQTALPFMRKWTRVPNDYEAIYQQMVSEIQQPDFVGSWEALTAWGTSPGHARSPQHAPFPG